MDTYCIIFALLMQVILVQFIFYLFIYLFIFVFCLFVVVVVAISWAAPAAYGGSQARG